MTKNLQDTPHKKRLKAVPAPPALEYSLCSFLPKLLDLAIQQERLMREIEACCPNSSVVLDQALERLSVQFDLAWAQAVKLGIPLQREWRTTNCEGHFYFLSLTPEGVEYRVA